MLSQPQRVLPVMAAAAHGIPAELLERLVGSLAPDRILLFGSRARGLARPASDIDLLLVGAWNLEPGPLLRHARHLVMHSFPRVDLVLCTPEEMAAAQAGHNTFLQSILASGVVLYQR